MWSEYLRIRDRRRQPSANSFASDLRCSVTAVPRSGTLSDSTVKSPSALDSPFQTPASAEEPALAGNNG